MVVVSPDAMDYIEDALESKGGQNSGWALNKEATKQLLAGLDELAEIRSSTLVPSEAQGAADIRALASQIQKSSESLGGPVAIVRSLKPGEKGQSLQDVINHEVAHVYQDIYGLNDIKDPKAAFPKLLGNRYYKKMMKWVDQLDPQYADQGPYEVPAYIASGHWKEAGLTKAQADSVMADYVADLDKYRPDAAQGILGHLEDFPIDKLRALRKPIKRASLPAPGEPGAFSSSVEEASNDLKASGGGSGSGSLAGLVPPLLFAGGTGLSSVFAPSSSGNKALSGTPSMFEATRQLNAQLKAAQQSQMDQFNTLFATLKQQQQQMSDLAQQGQSLAHLSFSSLSKSQPALGLPGLFAGKGGTEINDTTTQLDTLQKRLEALQATYQKSTSSLKEYAGGLNQVFKTANSLTSTSPSGGKALFSMSQSDLDDMAGRVGSAFSQSFDEAFRQVEEKSKKFKDFWKDFTNDLRVKVREALVDAAADKIESEIKLGLQGIFGHKGAKGKGGTGSSSVGLMQVGTLVVGGQKMGSSAGTMGQSAGGMGGGSSAAAQGLGMPSLQSAIPSGGPLSAMEQIAALVPRGSAKSIAQMNVGMLKVAMLPQLSAMKLSGQTLTVQQMITGGSGGNQANTANGGSGMMSLLSSGGTMGTSSGDMGGSSGTMGGTIGGAGGSGGRASSMGQFMGALGTIMAVSQMPKKKKKNAEIGAVLGAIAGSVVPGVGTLYGAEMGANIGGMFAKGGSPPVGKWSLVGEHGPELWMPKAPGVVIPNRTLEILSKSGSGGAERTISFGQEVHIHGDINNAGDFDQIVKKTGKQFEDSIRNVIPTPAAI